MNEVMLQAGTAAAAGGAGWEKALNHAQPTPPVLPSPTPAARNALLSTLSLLCFP